MRRMFILLVCVLALCGCKKQAPAVDVLEIDQATDAASPAAQSTPGSASGALATVRDTVACAFTGAQGDALYGAAVYENTGDAPLRLVGVRFTFTGEGKEAQEDFVPTLATYDVLLPGERGYVAAWFTETGFAPGEAAQLQAALSCEACEAARIPLDATDIFLADNYPGFTTMTGTLSNPGAQSCAMNMVYVGFYDAAEDFLGAWYFSKNAQLDGMDAIRFTTHMRSLPIPQLSQKAARFDCRAFGFN